MTNRETKWRNFTLRLYFLLFFCFFVFLLHKKLIKYLEFQNSIVKLNYVFQMIFKLGKLCVGVKIGKIMDQIIEKKESKYRLSVVDEG